MYIRTDRLSKTDDLPLLESSTYNYLLSNFYVQPDHGSVPSAVFWDFLFKYYQHVLSNKMRRHRIGLRMPVQLLQLPHVTTDPTSFDHRSADRDPRTHGAFRGLYVASAES